MVTLSRLGHCTKLSLTPPSSYIHQMFDTHVSPLSSADEDNSNSNSNSTTTTTSSTSHGHSDHCYTSLNSNNNHNNSSLLTPPESSEDEDSTSSFLSSPSPSPSSNFSKPRKSCLTQIANDRLNKDVKSLLKSTAKNMTKAVKPKFKFSIRMKKGSSSSTLPYTHRRAKAKKDKKSSRITISSYKALKENEQSLLFTSSQTVKVGCVNDKMFKTDKLNNREARDVHNQMERQRRSDLNRAYAILKDFVPSIANSDRTSKQMVLDKAIEHCTMLRKREEASREQKRNLHHRNEALRKKLQQLETQLAARQVESAEWEIQGW